MEDSEEFKVLALEIFVPLHFDIFAIQLDLLAQSIATAFYFLVMGAFLQLLCIE